MDSEDQRKADMGLSDYPDCSDNISKTATGINRYKPSFGAFFATNSETSQIYIVMG